MKYRHTVAFRVYGLTAPKVDVLLPTAAENYECVLTKNPDMLLADSDRSLAVSSLVLGGLFGNGLFGSSPAGQQTPEERITHKASSIREERTKQYSGSSYLVFRRHGEVDISVPDSCVELDSMVVCFDAVDKPALREHGRVPIAKSIASFSSAFPKIVRMDSVRDAVDTYRHDGKQIVSLTLSASAEAIVSAESQPGQIHAATSISTALRSTSSFDRVSMHLLQSLLTRPDKLRSFLSAWTALECFVNKVFAQHVKAYYADHRRRSQSIDVFVSRITEVMRDKYRLADKFALVAGRLDPTKGADDLTAFKAAKDLRDSFSHGDDVELGSLPTDSVLDLLRKYLGLHINAQVADG